MKPFCLEAALKGDKVVTRAGRLVKIAGYNPDAAEYCRIAGWVNGNLCSWDIEGKSDSHDRPIDLFMAPTERKEWVVVFRDPNNPIRPCIHFTDINDAKNAALTGTSTIHEITIIE